MYKQCNTEESARRQRQIEICLLELMQTVPYHQITIGDICLKVGLSRKSFYRYFSSKEGCLHSLVDHAILDAAMAYMSDDYIYRDHRWAFEHYFACWKKMKPLLEALCQNDLTTCLFERTLLCVAREDLDFLNYLNTDGSIDSSEQILFIVCGSTGLIINWHQSGYKKTPAEMAAILERLLAKSLVINPTQSQKL